MPGHCHDESHQHDHSNDLPVDSSAAGDKFSLYPKIDKQNVVALNAQGGQTAGQKVVKPWDQRQNDTEYCESDADDSLIISIPFTAQVKLRSITIKPGPGGLAPEKCHIHINSPGLDFSTYTDDLKPLETILLVNANSDTTAAARSDGIEYAVRPSKFSAVRSVQLVFPNNVSHGEEEETCRVCYVGLKGEWTELTKNPDGIILYEAQANPSDHKVKGVGELAGNSLGM